MFITNKNNLALRDRAFSIVGIGAFNYCIWPENKFWYAKIDSFGLYKIELRIATAYDKEPTQNQVNLIKCLPGDYDYYKILIYAYLEESYPKLASENFEQIFPITEIDLGVNGLEWLFTIEPFDAPRQYDHPKYFTVIDKKIAKAVGI